MNATDYKKILYTMFPPGPLWPHQEGDAPVWDTWISAIAQEAARVDSAAQEMILEAIPDATNYAYPSELLTKWEALAGLDGTGTDQERVQALIAQLRRRGNPTLSLFSAAASEIVDPSVAIDGYYVIDSLASTWTETATANVNYDAVPGPESGTTADEVELPATSDAIDADISRIANYEPVYVSFKIKLAGGVIDGVGSTLDIELTGRDSASKYYASVPVDNTWRRYAFNVSDVGTGGSLPNLSLTLSGGSGVTLHLYDVKAGWREKYFPQLVAGGLCGTPSAPGWEYVWGLEYGDDLTDRDGSNNPAWTLSVPANGTITNNYGYDRISRKLVSERLVTTGSTQCYVDVPCDADTDLRISFWLRALVDSYIRVYLLDKGGSSAYDSGWFWLYGSWNKIAKEINSATGFADVKIVVYADVATPIDILLSRVRASVVNDTLDDQISGSVPLHTSVVFMSEEELTGTGE